MAGIAIGLVWGAYWMGLYGYCLVRGYNVTPKQLLSTKVWPPGPVAKSITKNPVVPKQTPSSTPTTPPSYSV